MIRCDFVKAYLKKTQFRYYSPYARYKCFILMDHKLWSGMINQTFYRDDERAPSLMENQGVDKKECQ